MNQDVVKVVLDCKKEWENQDLFKLVEEYFENSQQTIDFCTALEKCLKRARDSQEILRVALQRFEEEHDGNEKYLRTMEELKKFKSSGDPFTEEFFQVFQSVYEQQISMLEKLQQRKSKIDKKFKSRKAWRKVSSIIFASAFAVALICSVVQAAMAAPPVIAALATAASTSLGPTGKWFHSLWKDYEVALKGQKAIISPMQLGTNFAINDMESIRALVEKMEIEIKSLMDIADFALRENDTVRFGIEEIKKKLEVFMNSIEDLGEHADKCSRNIARARTVVLQRIIKLPS